MGSWDDREGTIIRVMHVILMVSVDARLTRTLASISSRKI